MKIPLFPLQSVFFPGETVPLHIFEDRYKELINDCREEAITFGIPVYLNGQLLFGTEMQLEEIVKTYPNGEMDVVCKALRVFKLLVFDHTMDTKLYAGGIVTFLENINDGSNPHKAVILDLITELYVLMGVPFAGMPIQEYNSYALVHKIGLSLEQEHELLQIISENERLSFIESHLRSAIKILEEINRTKKTIELNGHFKNFDPLEFKDFEI